VDALDGKGCQCLHAGWCSGGLWQGQGGNGEVLGRLMLALLLSQLFGDQLLSSVFR